MLPPMKKSVLLRKDVSSNEAVTMSSRLPRQTPVTRYQYTLKAIRTQRGEAHRDYSRLLSYHSRQVIYWHSNLKMWCVEVVCWEHVLDTCLSDLSVLKDRVKRFSKVSDSALIVRNVSIKYTFKIDITVNWFSTSISVKITRFPLLDNVSPATNSTHTHTFMHKSEIWQPASWCVS